MLLFSQLFVQLCFQQVAAISVMHHSIIQRYLFNNYSESNITLSSKPLFSNLQRHFQCCGVIEVIDWRSKFPDNTSVPDSCCRKVVTGCGYNALAESNKDLFTWMCWTDLWSFTKKIYCITLVGFYCDDIFYRKCFNWIYFWTICSKRLSSNVIKSYPTITTNRCLSLSRIVFLSKKIFFTKTLLHNSSV